MREPRNERVSAKFQAAHMYIREFSMRKLEIKLNGAISDVQFKRSARTCPLSRGRAFRAGFRKHNARNGTRSEPRLRIILFFQISVLLFNLNGAEADIFFRFGIEDDDIVADDVETDRLIDRIVDRTEYDGR